VRIADVALGGALAGIAALIAPSSERARLPDALAAALDALRRYVELSFEILPAGDDQTPLAVVRREVGIAFENAEVSLERMLAEPKALRRGNADAAVLLTYGRRLAAALTSLAETTTRPVMPDAVKTDVLDAIAAARAHVLTGATIARPASARSVAPPLEKLVHYAALMRQIAVT